ncbi:putative chromosome segregation protein [Diaporthe ampelina]|uniref:Putative chromosome segregation protein n=1 Tax=Diaporthe ampelina TaxID=1214573 RepID=A0A0G2FYH0_9PEZI|nr:putative chromosome segregation protein [Diaporthe ampelina]
MVGDTTLPATRRTTRKSISAMERDNATVDLGAGTTLADNRKKSKSRSKSMGPGGALGAENQPDLLSGDDISSSGTKVALRTEEEQQAAAREREERERAALEKEIKDRREARRKSLANRRVSFAAEATLHTFHEVEYMQDSTASTDSTRRGSSAAAPPESASQADHTDPDASDTPSTPPEQIEETVAESPEDQRHLHQRNRRRSSGIQSGHDFDGQDDNTIASTIYDSDSDEGDDVAEVQTEASGSDSDSDNDGTMMTMEAEEMTSASLASTRYGDEADNTSSSLDGALREAARRAASQAREPDEDEEVISGFKGWGRKAREQREAASSAQEPPSDEVPSSPLKSSPEKSDINEGTEMEMDMDMTNAVGGIIQPTDPSSPDQAGQDDMSMDVTNVYGGILPHLQPPTHDGGSTRDEQTMEFTTAVGGIQRLPPSDDDQEIPSDEDMSMELTTVMGRVLGAKNTQLRQSLQLSSSPVKNLTDDNGDGDGPMETTMDVTKGIGHIISTSNEDECLDADGDGDTATGMELTAAVGGIVKPVSPAERTAAKKLMEQEADQPEMTTTPDLIAMRSPRKQPSSRAPTQDTLSRASITGIITQSSVAFEDPRIMEEEIDRERRDDQDRESGRRILEKEADDITSSLKEMIQGLSPKKKPLKGRKSLHVGSARGLLGKRPSELEDDSDAEVQDGVKRLKGHQGSPENPPLFREYITASPEFKNLMDNQFKNVKTNARLLSKAMWYDWRMKLQDGLREGLAKIAEGMTADEQLLDKQQKLLSSILPAMMKQLDTLTRECENLDAVASELEDCDPRELESARADLTAVEDDIEEKTKEIARLREQFKSSEERVGQLVEQKQRYNADIKEAEKIREECRGWSSTEISALKAKVNAIEKQHGWAITGVVGTSVSLSYRHEIELVFDTAMFRPGQQNSRIDLWYVAANRERKPVPLTPEREFCLQCIRDHLRCLPQSKTKVSSMLGLVSRAWDRTNALANQIYQLNLAFPTSAARTSDSSILITSTLLLASLQTKVGVSLSVQNSVGIDGLEFIVSAQAAIIYGEQFNAAKMAEFLSNRIGQHVYCPSEKDGETWVNVVADLHARLLARGKK